MARDPIAVRLYFERPLYEAARLIGYARVELFAFWDQSKQLDLPKEKLLNAVYDLAGATDGRAGPLTLPGWPAIVTLERAPSPERPFS